MRFSRFLTCPRIFNDFLLFGCLQKRLLESLDARGVERPRNGSKARLARRKMRRMTRFRSTDFTKIFFKLSKYFTGLTKRVALSAHCRCTNKVFKRTFISLVLDVKQYFSLLFYSKRQLHATISHKSPLILIPDVLTVRCLSRN